MLYELQTKVCWLLKHRLDSDKMEIHQIQSGIIFSTILRVVPINRQFALFQNIFEITFI